MLDEVSWEAIEHISVAQLDRWAMKWGNEDVDVER